MPPGALIYERRSRWSLRFRAIYQFQNESIESESTLIDLIEMGEAVKPMHSDKNVMRS